MENLNKKVQEALERMVGKGLVRILEDGEYELTEEGWAQEARPRDSKEKE